MFEDESKDAREDARDVLGLEEIVVESTTSLVSSAAAFTPSIAPTRPSGRSDSLAAASHLKPPCFETPNSFLTSPVRASRTVCEACVSGVSNESRTETTVPLLPSLSDEEPTAAQSCASPDNALYALPFERLREPSAPSSRASTDGPLSLRSLIASGFSFSSTLVSSSSSS